MPISLFKKKKKEKLPARQRGNACLNCNVTLDGEENFCPECGQRNNINQLNFKLVVDEFIGNLITYDSRVWNTTVPLIVKPGKVAYEFISGKRKHFVNPFRTYFTISLLFFLIYGLLGTISKYRGDSEEFKPEVIKNTSGKPTDSLSREQKDSIVRAAISQATKAVPVQIDSAFKAENINIDLGTIKAENISMDSLKNLAAESDPFFRKVRAFYNHYEKNQEQPITKALDTLGYENSFWNRFYYDKTQKTYDIFSGGLDEFNQKLFSSLSLAIFIFLPVFGLFLKFIYLRRSYTYMEHLVFIFYTQSVFFLLLLLFAILSFAFKDTTGSLLTLAVLVFSIYLLLAMKKFYKQGWIKTIVKFMMSNFAFMIIAAFGGVILVFVSFLFY